MKLYLQFLFCLILTSCITNKRTSNSDINNHQYKVKSDSLNLFDKSRNRLIPIAFYSPKTDNKKLTPKVVIFSHGYSENRLGANKAYSYLTEELASKGYYVVSIQHELPTDDLLPTKGVLQIVRRPFWESGCENILFVINELKKINPELDYKHLILIGHSNGGDISVLFTHKYPQLVDKIISLDNRRMQLPRTEHPKVYSLRSSDQIADEGVLPTLEEQEKMNMKIIRLPNTFHNDMNDNGTQEQKKEINNYINSFLNN
jgi:dienelactone hydrolase